MIFGMFVLTFLTSILSTKFPANMIEDILSSLGKFSSLESLLSVKSMVSKAFIVAPKCSIVGMPNPRRTNSLSPNGLGRCSTEFSSSADNLMM